MQHMSRRTYKVLSAREKLSISAREKSALRTMRKQVGSKALKLIQTQTKTSLSSVCERL